VEHEVKFNYSARYCKSGNINHQTKVLWFVLHGYGQLASYFIEKFRLLNDKSHCVIAPEGLNRFYNQGFSGRVGANWMTKEDRLKDIKNYINYLNSIYHSEIPSDPAFKIKILGFSQGAATASRWVTQSTVHFDSLILWAGIFPPDMKMKLSKKRLNGKNVFFVIGLNDPFVSNEKLSEQQRLASRLELSPKIITYDGNHDIDSNILAKIAEQ